MRRSKDSPPGPQPSEEASSVSRRGFLKGAGLTVAAVGVAGPSAMPQAAGTEDDVKVFGPDPVDIELQINGEKQTFKASPMTTLLELLREQAELTGAKRVCDRGFCGACTVNVDGRTVNSCSFLAFDAVGRKLTTVEGLSGPDEDLTPMQAAFVECDALQCGFCTPGMVMSCTALLAKNPSPSRDEVAAGISGNICRCGTYANIFEAVELAAGKGGRKK